MQRSTISLAAIPATAVGRQQFNISSYFVKSQTLTRLALLLPGLMLALSICAPAESPNQTKFHGVLNDYAPASTGGPWEVRGSWSVVVKCRYGQFDCKADFSAALTMERSDEGINEHGNGDFNSTNPMDRMAHTHHITLVDGQVTAIAGGIEIKGPARITGNGTFPPPFQTNTDLSTLTIDITGGNTVAFSNIAVTFGDQAAGHFGMSPLHGVVRKSSDKSDK
ncbi:MAG TPA: hypothetical protein VFA65_11310 [Bryobacteraceae bacterium]|nr:hypothetical protein [Bryobacteraceae bacterium]